MEQHQKEVMAKITLMQQHEAEKRVSIEANEQAKRAVYVNEFMKKFEEAEKKRTYIESTRENKNFADIRLWLLVLLQTIVPQ